MGNTKLVNPFRCRMWELHDRLGENITVGSCASLIESFQKHGQKQPVLGRLLQDDPNYDVELVYGARRLFVARHLATSLLVNLTDMDDRAGLIEMDIENRVREDISPYERGMSYKRWLRAGHFAKQSELARAIGVSEAQVSRLLRYAELPVAVVGAFTSPSDIREEWAVALAKACQDPETRERTIHRARAIAASDASPMPHQRYELLIAARNSTRVPVRPRDDIVRSRSGKPIFRVSFRTKSVHLIFQRNDLSREHLDEIVAGVAHRLDVGADKLARSAACS